MRSRFGAPSSRSRSSRIVSWAPSLDTIAQSDAATPSATLQARMRSTS
ncbi:MAG: hypothetical protein GY913_07900 [Proteobacteria bacterium]|nr:hypothetical protein [Pseudomonadota bacterium]MCP4916835.1 hypothetical protein [Pseudomonadota bacterium]